VSVRQHPELELAGLWQRGQDLDEMVAAADVVIDFSLPEGTELVLEAVVRHRKPLVCGVTGLNESQLALLVVASDKIPRCTCPRFTTYTRKTRRRAPL